MKIANDPTHRHFVAYRQYVQDAIAVAQGHNTGKDPSPAGLYAWRTAGAKSPGPNFEKFQTLGGQDFYTLTKEFRDDPLLRGRP